MFDQAGDGRWSAIASALRQSGFGSIKLTGPLRDDIHRAFSIAADFFALSIAEKLLNALPHDCGYHPAGLEYTDSDRPDPIESFSVSARNSSELVLASESARELRDRMTIVFDELESIAERVIAEMAKLTGSDHARSTCGLIRRWSLLQINHVIPSLVQNNYIHPAHEDGNLLTLAIANEPGLEVQCQDGSFQSAGSSNDDAIVLTGDMAWVLSGGVFPRAYHRVRYIGTGSRLALLFSADIDPGRCECWVVNDSNRAIDLRARLLANQSRYGLTGFKVEQEETDSG
jgi:isopenicillin N synthase-like dioxygenase